MWDEAGHLPTPAVPSNHRDSQKPRIETLPQRPPGGRLLLSELLLWGQEEGERGELRPQTLCPGHLPRPTLLPAPLPQKRATRGTHLALNPRPATFRCGGQQATPPLRAALPAPSLAAENVRVERSTSGAGQSPKPRFALSPRGWGLGEDAEGLLPPAGPARKESVDANSHGTGQPPKSLVCSKPLGGAVAEGANAWSRVRARSAGHSRASAAQVLWAGVGVARESRQRLQQEVSSLV